MNKQDTMGFQELTTFITQEVTVSLYTTHYNNILNFTSIL